MGKSIKNFINSTIDFFIKDIPIIWNDFLVDLSKELKKPRGFFYLVLGCFWVVFYVGIRFFRDLTGYNIIELRENSISVWVFTGFTIFVFVNFVILFGLCYSYYKKKYNRPTSKYADRVYIFFRTWINELFWKPVYSLHSTLHKNIPFSAMFFEFLERKFFYHPLDRMENGEKYYYSYAIIFMFDTLPRIGTAFVFFIEVVFFCRVHYFLYCLPFLLLPILLKIFLQFMYTYGVKGYKVARSFLKVARVPQDSLVVIYGRFKFYKRYSDVYVKDEYRASVTPITAIYDMIMLSNISMQSYFIRREIQRFSQLVLWITCLLYFFGGLYRLLLICNFF